MIHNQRQYQQSRVKRQEFVSALDRLRAQPLVPDLKRQIHEQALASQIEAFDQELARYEELTSGAVLFEPLDLIERLPELLIELRLAAGLTHKALGDLLSIHEEQIRRYESTSYGAASLKRVLTVFETCRERIRERPETSAAEWSAEPPVQPPPEFFMPQLLSTEGIHHA